MIKLIAKIFGSKKVEKPVAKVAVIAMIPDSVMMRGKN